MMELVGERPLTGVLADGRPDLAVALDWAQQIALALRRGARARSAVSYTGTSARQRPDHR